MLVDVLEGILGVAGLASGVSALVFYRNHGKNGHVPLPPVATAPFEVTVQGLDALPERIEQGLAPVFEGFVRQVTDMHHDALAVAMSPVRTAEPENWAQVSQDLERISDRLDEPVPPPSWPPEVVLLFERLVERLDNLQIPAPQSIDLEPLVELSRNLPERFAQQMGEMLAAERNRVAKSVLVEQRSTRLVAGGAEASASGGPPRPPVRRAPPNLPRLTPGALPAMPTIPTAYVPGSVFVPAGEVWSLLVLIQQQLSPNCPGSGQEFLIASDPGNTGSILVGGASSIGGPLTADNYAYELTASSPPRIYRSAYPGSSTPVGELQVLAPDGGFLHVEVQS